MTYSLLLVLLLAVSYQQKPAEPQKEAIADLPPLVDRSQKQFSYLPGGKITVSLGVPGSCRITGWQRSSVLLEVERIVYHLGPDQAKALLEQFPVQTRWTQTTATITVPASPKVSPSIEVNLTLHVPKEKTDVTVNLVKGDFSAGALNGWIEATLQEGNVEASSLSGYFSSSTQQGDVRVELSGKRWLGYGFTAITKKGSIDLRLPVDFSAALQLQTLDGDLSIAFPPQIVDGAETPLVAVTQKNGKSLIATLGDGGAPLRLHSTAGTVRLSALPPR